MLALVTLKWVTLPVAVMLGTLLVFVTRCITPPEAYSAVEWKAIILIGSMLSLGAAMEHTGAAKYLAGLLLSVAGTADPRWLLTAFFAEWLLPAWLETAWGGQTPGKRLFGIMVLNFAIVQFAPGGPVERLDGRLRGVVAERLDRAHPDGGVLLLRQRRQGLLDRVRQPEDPLRPDAALDGPGEPCGRDAQPGPLEEEATGLVGSQQIERRAEPGGVRDQRRVAHRRPVRHERVPTRSWAAPPPSGIRRVSANPAERTPATSSGAEGRYAAERGR